MKGNRERGKETEMENEIKVNESSIQQTKSVMVLRLNDSRRVLNTEMSLTSAISRNKLRKRPHPEYAF